MKSYQNYINGKWMDSQSKEKIQVEDPATTNIIGEIACAKSEDVDLVVEAAKKSFDSRILVDMPILERAKLMRNIANETRKVAKEGGTLLCYENGKQIVLYFSPQEVEKYDMTLQVLEYLNSN